MEGMVPDIERARVMVAGDDGWMRNITYWPRPQPNTKLEMAKWLRGPGIRPILNLMDPPSPDDIVDKLRELVSVNYLDHDTAAMHIRATALVARLKSLNRAANTATRTRKNATAETRQEMDQTNLGLQNLLYEKRHLEREIEKCRQFA